MKDYFVSENVKKERVKKVLDLSLQLENTYYKKFIGQTQEVIVETSKNDTSLGHTDNYILVSLDKQVESGIVVPVMIDEVDGVNVKGHIINID